MAVPPAQLIEDSLNQLLHGAGVPSISFDSSYGPWALRGGSGASSKVQSSSKLDQMVASVDQVAFVTSRWAANIKRQANILKSPIYTLPVELLSKILDVVINEETFDNEDVDPLKILRTLRLVSSHWSHIIDTYPQFWTTIHPSTPLDGLIMVLEKSQSLPLSVIVRHGSQSAREPEGEYFDRLVRQANRWGSLDIEVQNSFLLRILLQQPTPLLKKFRLSADLEDPDEQESMDLDILPYMDWAIMDWAPALENVSFISWGFKWDSPALCGLRTLTIWSSYIHLRDLLQILARCPQLVQLDVNDSLTTALAAQSSSTNIQEAVHLPKLQLLCIEGSCALQDNEEHDACASVFGALVLPPTTRVRLRGLFCCSEKVASWVRAESREWACENILRIHVRHGRRLGSVELEYGDGPHFRTWSSTWDSEPSDDITSLLMGVSDQVRPGGTDTTHFTHEGPASAARNWLARLNQCFPAIKRLTLSVRDPKDSIQLLSTPYSDQREDGEQWMFASLEYLDVEAEGFRDEADLMGLLLELGRIREERVTITDVVTALNGSVVGRA